MIYEIRTLTTDYVNIRNIENGSIHRKVYNNSKNERLTLREEIPSPFSDAVLLVWGDTPTVDESVED